MVNGWVMCDGDVESSMRYLTEQRITMNAGVDGKSITVTVNEHGGFSIAYVTDDEIIDIATGSVHGDFPLVNVNKDWS